MNGIPKRTPRHTPQRDVSFSKLIESMILNIGKHFEDRSPKSRFGRSMSSLTIIIVREIGLLYICEDMILVVRQVGFDRPRHLPAGVLV